MTSAEFEQLVDSTKRYVLAAVRHTLAPQLKQFVDDVVQDTYLKAYRRLSQVGLDGVESVENYLYTIAKRECMAVNDRYRKQVQVMQQYVQERDLDGGGREADVLERDVVDGLVKELPEGYRSVMELFFKGFAMKDIAAGLRLSLGTVKSKLFRGKRLMVESYHYRLEKER